MQNQYSPVIEKSFEIIKRFEEKFGVGFFDAASELNMRIIRKERGL